jgi:hypothetical protein
MFMLSFFTTEWTPDLCPVLLFSKYPTSNSGSVPQTLCYFLAPRIASPIHLLVHQPLCAYVAKEKDVKFRRRTKCYRRVVDVSHGPLRKIVNAWVWVHRDAALVMPIGKGEVAFKLLAYTHGARHLHNTYQRIFRWLKNMTSQYQRWLSETTIRDAEHFPGIRIERSETAHC